MDGVIKGGNPDLKACNGQTEADENYREQEQAFVLVRQGLVDVAAKQKVAMAAQDLRNQKLQDLQKTEGRG